MYKVNYIIRNDLDYIYIRLSHRVVKAVRRFDIEQPMIIYLCEKIYNIIKNSKYDYTWMNGSWPNCTFEKYNSQGEDYYIKLYENISNEDKFDYIQDSSGFCGGLYKDYIRIKYDKKLLAKLKLIL